MALSLSFVVLLGVVLVVMIRSGVIRVLPAIVAALFGFFLAPTGVAPTIQDLMDSLAEAISNLNF